MLLVMLNIEAGNYYSKSTFTMTQIKQEKLVFVLVILYIQEHPKISNFRYPFPKITENEQP